MLWETFLQGKHSEQFLRRELRKQSELAIDTGKGWRLHHQTWYGANRDANSLRGMRSI